jgi:spermidine synthase
VTDRWFDERLYDDVRFSFRAEEVLVEEAGPPQELALITNERFGRVLLLDGITQITEADEFVYSEMMAHVPIVAHGSVRRVLIIGGGDGAIAQEVLSHREVERCTLVDIDPAVVEFSRQHLAAIHQGVFDDPRFELHIGDGAAYVEDGEDRFDVIIVDSTDPIGPGAVLFTRQFYAGCHRSLTPGGVLVTQNGVPFLQADELASSVGHFASIFADAGCYLAPVPTYVGGHLAMGWATDDPGKRRLGVTELAARWQQADVTTRYYTPEVHAAAFALPRFVADVVDTARAHGAAHRP